MRQLTSYISNPFRKLRIGVDILIRFSRDHLERLRLQNDGGQFDDRITATESALRRLIDTCTINTGSLGLRKSCKLLKNRFRKSLLPEIAKIHAKVISVFGGRSSNMKEFFPHGRSIYKTAGDDEIEVHLGNLRNQVAAHVNVFGTGTVTEVNSLFTSWKEIHAASEHASGQKAASEADRRDARAALEVELQLNLTQIASVIMKSPQDLGLYMQEHLLVKRTSGRGNNETEIPSDA